METHSREKLKHFKKGRRAIHCPERLNKPVLDILSGFNAEIRGLYEYYSLAENVAKRLYKFKHYHYQSLLKTIASKEKSTRSRVLRKYGVLVPRKIGTGVRKVFGVHYKTKTEMKTLTYFNDSLVRKEAPAKGKAADGIFVDGERRRCQIIDRINANKCELCGYYADNPRELEVHHVRHLKTVTDKYRKRGAVAPEWVVVMSAMNRKTLVVCKPCHRKIHNGTINKSLTKNEEGTK